MPQAFENIFAKYAVEEDVLTFSDVMRFWKGQRLISDPIGWCGAIFECEYYFLSNEEENSCGC